MQFRGLLIAAVLLAGLAGGIWYSNKQAETAKTKPADSKTVRLVDSLAADVVEVSITPRGGQPLTIRKDPGKTQWEMLSEPKFPVEQDAAQNVMANASSLASDNVIEEAATDLIQYGLDPAQSTVVVKDKNGKTTTVLLGDATPVANLVYAMKPGSKKVFAIANYLKTELSKSAIDLRDKRMLPVDEAKLARMELLRPGLALEFGKNGKGEWQVLKPKPMRTDNLAVDEVFRKAKDAKFDPALGADELQKNAASFGSAAVIATLKLSDAAGTQTLEVRKTKEAGYLGKASVIAGVFKIGDELGTGLEKSLDDFRNKKLLGFGFEDPARVVIKNGTKVSTLEKKGEDWQLNGKKADSGNVQGLIDSLRSMAALKFVDKGFTTSFYEISVTQKDGKSTEKLMISKTGNFHYAKREGEADEYEVDPKVISDLDAALGSIEKPPAPAPKK
jgi:hypothetical protein